MIVTLPSRAADRRHLPVSVGLRLARVILVPFIGCLVSCHSQSATNTGQPPASPTTLPTRAPDPDRQTELPETEIATEPRPADRELSFESQVELVRAGARDSIEINQSPVSDEQLGQLSNLSNLRVLILNQGSVTDKGITALVACQNLTRIRLRSSPLTGTALATLAQLPHLQWLNLPDAQFDNAALAAVQQMPQLQMLRIGSPAVDDTGIAALRAHPGLRFVHLIEIPVTDRSLDVFGSLPRLESLYLDGVEITDEGWTAWFDAHRDVHVHLDQAHHDRDPAKH